MSSDKIWIDKHIADLLDQAVEDTEATYRLLSRHLQKLDIITRAIAEGKIDTREKMEKLLVTLRASAQSLHSARHSLKNNKRAMY